MDPRVKREGDRMPYILTLMADPTSGALTDALLLRLSELLKGRYTWLKDGEAVEMMAAYPKAPDFCGNLFWVLCPRFLRPVVYPFRSLRQRHWNKQYAQLMHPQIEKQIQAAITN